MEKLLELLRSSLQANLEQLHPTDRPHAQRRLGEAMEEAGAYLAEVTGRLKLLDEKLQASQQGAINKNMAQRMQALEYRENLLTQTFIALGLSLRGAGQRRTATVGLYIAPSLENPIGAFHLYDCLCVDCAQIRKRPTDGR